MFDLGFDRGLFACLPGAYMYVCQRRTFVRPPRT
nr:MAG TPA: hypothetical protein [Caudoviricetes sp.]